MGLRKSPVKMSSRLHRVADMITPGRIVADIGTDHGYIPIYEVLTGRAGYAYACDVAEGPLGRARDNVSLYNVGDRVQTVLSDGLKGLKNIKDNIPEAIVIAGMGGSLICRILSEGAEAAQNAKELILSPHSEWYDVRKFLYDNGYTITDEDMLREDGKYYVVIKAGPSKAGDNGTAGSQRSDTSVALQDEQFRDELCYGPVLIRKKHTVLVDYLRKELDTCGKIRENLLNNGGTTAKEKLAEFDEKEAVLRRVLKKIAEV